MELVSDGIALIHPNGRLEPCNEAMARLVAQVGGAAAVSSLDGLNLDPEDHGDMVAFLGSDAEQHRAVVKMRQGNVDTVCAVTMHRQPEGTVLAAFQDQSPVRRAADRHDRLERWRCLGQLADGLVHDLNNLLGAMLAMVDSMSVASVDDADRTLMQSLRSGTREGARLLQQIGKLMRRHGPTLERFSLADALGDAVRMVHKSARLGDTEVTFVSPRVDPFVRGNANALIHLLCEIAARMIGTSQWIRFELSIRQIEPARHGLPARRYGAICVFADEFPRGFAELPEVLSGKTDGLLNQINEWQRDGAGLLAVMMGVLADGGHLSRVTLPADGDQAEEVGLCIGLPLVSSPAMQSRVPEDAPLELPRECMVAGNDPNG